MLDSSSWLLVSGSGYRVSGSRFKDFRFMIFDLLVWRVKELNGLKALTARKWNESKFLVALY